MRKIITLVIMLLFLGMTISSTAEESTLNDDIEIKIFAGYFGFFKLDIGHGLRIWIKNPNGENVTFFFNINILPILKPVREALNLFVLKFMV